MGEWAGRIGKPKLKVRIMVADVNFKNISLSGRKKNKSNASA